MLTFQDVHRCIVALCSYTTPTRSMVKQYAARFTSRYKLCEHLLVTRWNRASVLLRIEHLHRSTVRESLDETKCIQVAKKYFIDISSAVTYVNRLIFHEDVQELRSLTAVNTDTNSSTKESTTNNSHCENSTTYKLVVHPNCTINKTKPNVGVIITTYGHNGIYVRQCISSFYRSIPSEYFNVHIILYINEVTDSLTPTLGDVFPDLTTVYIENQTEHGGLTGTWNKGIDWCLHDDRKCDIIVLSNDDLFVMSCFRHILDAATACRPDSSHPSYFGPVTNNPGPSKWNKWQYSMCPKPSNSNEHEQSHMVVRTSSVYGLNGFLMVFPSHILTSNKFDTTHYFDPNKPFGGNEIEWAERFFDASPDHRAVVVPQTFVYHTKLGQWRPEKNNYTKQNGPTCSDALPMCTYTVNIAGYDSNLLVDHTEFGFPVICFTDSESFALKCVAKGVEPMIVDVIGGDTVRTQRAIKAAPHRFLPSLYKCSIYLDGNCRVIQKHMCVWLQWFVAHPNVSMLCWKHPDRSTIRTEAAVVERKRLEYPSKIQAMLDILDKDHYTEDKDVVLTETNVLIRRHHQIANFGDDWSKHTQICRRDQLSFDYLVTKHGVNVYRGEYSEKPVTRMPHSHIAQSIRQLAFTDGM